MVALICIIQATGSLTLYGIIDVYEKYHRMMDLRPPGLHGNPNMATLYLIFGYCAGLMLLAKHWRANNHFRLVAHLLVLALMIWAMYLGQSRSGLLGISVITILYLGEVLQLRKLTIGFLLSILTIVLTLFPEVVFDILNNIFAHRKAPTDFGREYLWSKAAEVIVRSPFFGEPSAVFDYGRSNFHNDLLAQATNAGLPAALLFAGLLLVPLWKTFRARRQLDFPSYADLVFYVALAAIVHGMFHVVLQGGICFWMLLGLAVNNNRLRDASRLKGSADYDPTIRIDPRTGAR